MATNLFFIQEHLGRDVFHGGIGNVDAEKVFIKKGFMPVNFPFHYSYSLRAKLARSWFLIKTVCTFPSHASIIFQFPLYAGMSRLLVKLLGYRKSIRIICFITDIDGLKDNDETLLEKEIESLRRFHHFIVHNETMKQWLLSKHPSAQASVIDFFDFLTAPVNASKQKSNEVVFAGNLAKSNFLDKLGALQTITFAVYGKDPSPLMLQQSNVSYKGFAEPYALPAKLEGAFGLVWDGAHMDEPNDSLGNYMRFISHHKLSLYIISGLPVITWKHAASAPLVKKYGIGITIGGLHELQKAIDAVTEEEYRIMVANTKALAPTIATGERLGKAIDELINKA
jgi:hypothetical protein